MKQLLAPEEHPGAEGAKESGGMGAWPMVLSLISLVLVLLGLFGPSTLGATVLNELSFFALAAVVGIWARIAQAQKHHSETMDELRRR